MAHTQNGEQQGMLSIKDIELRDWFAGQGLRGSCRILSIRRRVPESPSTSFRRGLQSSLIGSPIQ